MTEGLSQGRDAPQTSDVYEVPRDMARGVLINSVESSLISVKIRDADGYNDQTRFILQQCIHLMPLGDQNTITDRLDEIEAIEDMLEKTRSPFRRFFLVMKYKLVSKKTFLMVKKASNRLINNQIRGRSRASTGPQDPPPLNQGSFTTPVPRAPMPTPVQPPTGDNPPTSITQGRAPLHDVSLHNVERVEVTTLQSRTTGDPLVVLEMYEMNQRSQQFVATLQSLPPDDNMTDGASATQMFHPDATEASTIHTISDAIGSSLGVGN